jgi:AraC-like DNA-binding protein
MLKRFDESREDLKPYGLSCELWQPNLMRRADRHNEIEINYLPNGSITYLIHDQKIKIEKGNILVFWALLPHQIVAYDDISPYYVITVPFALFSQWNMPQFFSESLFKGEVRSLKANKDMNVEIARFQEWLSGLSRSTTYLNEICALEIQAYVKRLALQVFEDRQFQKQLNLPPINLVEQMALYIASNFVEPIKVSHIAKAVELNPDYANSIFKKTFGVSISNYLAEQRVLCAQRKLSVNSDSITSIGYESGFNSISSFNATFKRFIGITPRDYRKKIKMQPEFQLKHNRFRTIYKFSSITCSV